MDLIERLRFDAARCEATFSLGVATNIEEAAAEIERLRLALQNIIDEADGDDGLAAWDGADIARAALANAD